MLRLLPHILVFLVAVGASLPAVAEEDSRAKASAEFSRGETLYKEGKYKEAIGAFMAAYEILPHAFSLFNIARCHENLGEVVQALKAYERALSQAKEPGLRKDVQARIDRIASMPTKIFVTSRPSGAMVTIDGRAEPETKQTPLVVRLKPGEHILIFRKPGHLLTVQRVVVEAGREKTVEVAIKPEPKPVIQPASRPASLPVKAEAAQLTDFDGLHLHLGVSGTMIYSVHRDLVSGLGIHLEGSYGRVLFGGLIDLLPLSHIKDAVTTTDGTTAITTGDFSDRLLLIHAFGGWAFPFRNFYLYATGSVGYFVRIQAFGDAQAATLSSKGFTWSVGGGIRTMIIPWLSIGIGLRFGLMHGSPIDPYGTMHGELTFHL
jgi:hypothetical protein